jgi:hypothetical protein
MQRIALFSFLVVSAFSGCRCGEDLQALAPKIEIGDPFDATHKICQKNFVEDCSFDYGTVGIGHPKLFTFAIRNPSNVDLNIKSITIVGSPNFKVQLPTPDVILATQGAVGKNVTVTYDPQTATSETAKVVIKSDAENIAPGTDVEIDLKGSGKDLGCPQLTVSPSTVDFGAVGVGATGQQQLTFTNSGNQDLEITDLSFSPDTPPGVFQGVGFFPIPTYVQSGTGVTAAYAATPTSASPISGTLKITSNDCQNPIQNIPFTVAGAQTPTAVARVKSINGQPNTSANPQVQPLDDVVVSGDQSTAGTSGASIVSYAWTIKSKPNDSSVRLSSPNSVDTGFQFDSANGVVAGLDVAGTFVVSLVVTDSNGASSANDATVTLNAVPLQGLHVQLTWSSAADDIDLHLFKGSSPGWCSDTNDCYYGDCKSDPFGFTQTPDWDGIAPTPPATKTAGDPSLDIDDLCGFGPENINIDQPVNGSYVIGVDPYSPGGGDCTAGSFTPTDVEVKVFLGGALAGQFTNHFDADNVFWTVARVDVNVTSSVVGINTMGPKDASATCLGGGF